MLNKIWIIGGHSHATPYKETCIEWRIRADTTINVETDFMEFEEAYISSAHEVEYDVLYMHFRFN